MVSITKSLILALAVIVSSVSTETDFDFRSDEYIAYLNSLDTTWKAGRNFDADTPVEQIKAQLGAWGVTEELIERSDVVDHSYIPDSAIPDHYDARTAYPQCSTIKQIRDQGACGSCWAFAAVEAMSDRICIASNQSVEISAENLLACCNFCGSGCRGGYPQYAWYYWVENGLVSGGGYHTQKTCQPYSIAECSHGQQGSRPMCGNLQPTPRCHHECTVSGYQRSYEQDKHYGKSHYHVGGSVENIQKEIMTHGPIEAGFMVYDDFVHYKSGVYQRHGSRNLGGHAVKIIGWGEEGGVPYWLIANSWNEDWGDHGLFKMRRGTNECGIEGNLYAGLPKV